MTDAELYLELLLVTAAAFTGGALAQALRLPTIIGFLIAGIAIGPSTPGPVGDIADVGRAADLGVIFLMFSIGIQFSFRQLIDNRRLIFVGGGLQIASTMALGIGVGLLLGLDWTEAIVIGFLAPNTSTVVTTKVLERRQELQSLPAIAAINISILQDITAVLMVIAVPSLGGEALAAQEILFAIGKGILLVAVTFLLGAYVLPVAWQRLAHARSRELSLLAALTLAIGLAAGSSMLGLSVAFGAFLAGLAVSENAYGYSTLSDIIPLREIFASVFFVLIGMLVQPEILWQEPLTVLAIALVVTIGKALLSTVALRVVGLAIVPAVMTGLILSQVGEFSFVIARVAMAENVVSSSLSSAFLAAAIISIVINPGLVRLGPGLGAAASRLRFLSTAPVDPVAMGPTREGYRRHVVIAGWGNAAESIARSLSGRNLPYVIVDSNPFLYDDLRRNSPEVPFVFGDPTRPETLDLAGVREARVLAVTLPNITESQIAIANARSLNPRIDVVTRGTLDNHSVLRQAGSSEVVDPEFEAALEFVRHVLHRYGIDAREIAALQARRRAEYYGDSR